MLALAEYHKNPIDLTKKDITFSEVFALWSADYFKRSPSSRAGLVAAFKRCEEIHNMPMKDIRKIHLQGIIDGMASMSEQSQRKTITVFKMSFRYCLENDLLSKDYSQFVTISEFKPASVENKFFTTEELEKVLANPCDPVLMLLYTGVRVGELLGIRSEDIQLKERLIHVRGTKTKNANRLVPIHHDLVPVIARNMGGEYLISEHRTYNAFTRKIFRPYLESLGIDHTPHATRHTFISMMDKCGVNPVTLKRIAGHSNESMTEHYTHKEQADLIEAIDALTLIRH